MFNFVKEWIKPQTAQDLLSTVDALKQKQAKDPMRDILIGAKDLSRGEDRVFNIDQDLIDDLAPAHIEFERSHVIIGDEIYASFLYVTNLPTSLSRPVWRRIMNFPGAIYVSIHCDVIPPHEAAAMLRRESNAIVAKQLFRAYNQQRTDSVDSVRTRRVEEARIQTELVGEPLIYLSITIGVMSTSRESLEQKVKAIQQELQLAGIQAYTASYEQMLGLSSILPLGINSLHHHCRNVSPYALAQMFPNFSEEVAHPRGFVFGIDENSHTLSILDPYEMTNPNIVGFGKPGSGKSFFMKSIIDQAIMHSIPVYVLDIEGEYLALCRELGGVYLPMSLNSEHKLNILDVSSKDEQAFQEGYQAFEAWVSALLAMNQINAGSGFSAALGHAYKLAFSGDLYAQSENGNAESGTEAPMMYSTPTLHHIVAALEKIKEENLFVNQQLAMACEAISNALKNYTSGMLQGIFDVESNVQIGMSPLVVFGLRDAGDEKVKLLRVIQTMIWIWNKILSDTRRKLVVLDEAWYFLQNESTAKILAEWARRVRKKNTALLIGTQALAEFETNQYANTIFNIAETYLFFRSSQTGIDKIAALGKLTDKERGILPQLQPGRFLLHSAGYRRVIYNVVPKNRYMLYTTKPSDMGF